MKKSEEKKRGRGRPRKPEPAPAEKKKTDSPAQQQPEENSLKGIITEDELLNKAESIRKTGEELPAEHQTEIEPGTGLENDLIKLASGEEITENTEVEQPAATSPEPMSAGGDVIAEMENNIVLVPLEEGLGLKKGFLRINEDEQKLLAMVRPDDMEAKKSQEWYWGIFGLLNLSKALKWYLYNLRQKKEAKKKAEEKPKPEPDELTREFIPVKHAAERKTI